MAKTLTAAAVAKLKPAPQRREVPDGSIAGLRLVIQPSGRKSWAIRYRRRGDGRMVKLTLGQFDASGREIDGVPQIGQPLTLAAARSLAAEVHRQRAMGHEPAVEVQAAKRRHRVEQEQRSASAFPAAARQFIEEYARPKNRGWRTTATILGLRYPDDGEPETIRGSLADRWRGKSVAEVDGADIYAVVDEARRTGIPGTRSRTKAISDARGREAAKALSKFFGWLLQHRKIAANPCAGMYVPPQSAARDRVLTADEVRLFWRAAAEMSEPFPTMLKLLLLTGCRLREVAGMRRVELTDDAWIIPGERTKNKRAHVVPLPPLARDLIDSAPRIEGEGLVITTTGRTPVSGFSKMKRQLDAAMLRIAKETDPQAELTPWRLHDLRRTCATGMAEIGVQPHIVEACINHISGHKAGVAGTYNRATYSNEKRAALQRWAAHVEGLVSGKAAKVLPMRSKAS